MKTFTTALALLLSLFALPVTSHAQSTQVRTEYLMTVYLPTERKAIAAELRRFVAVTRQVETEHIAGAIADAVAEERDRCAKLAAAHEKSTPVGAWTYADGWNAAAQQIAEAIREEPK